MGSVAVQQLELNNMSIETRSSSALFKRAEQLKRWEQSETNREPVSPKQKSRKIKFSSGCVFLAACAAADKEEVLRLLQKGADINTANVDGLTALHQACIDDNLDMVEFLVEYGADVNRGDNEGWTPLHATASCGFKSIAKYLLESGADVAAINNDGELALDIAEEQSMEELLQQEIEEKGVDCNEARSQEERLMLRDAREWLNAGGDQVDLPHPKTGATALHVASAKGYIKVMNLLLQCKSEVDKQDNDGWTPIHAAAHWGQFDAAKLLADNLADMDMKNYVGQTAFDVADSEMFRHLEDVKKRQNKEELTKKKQLKKKTDAKGRQPEAELETPTKVKRVEVEIEENEKEMNVTENTVGDMDLSSSDSDTETESSSSESEASCDISVDDEKKNRVNSLTDAQRIPTKDQNSVVHNSVPTSPTPPTSPVKLPVPATPAAPTIPPPRQISEQNSDDNMPSWRRPGSFRTRVNSDNKNLNLRIDNKDKSPSSGAAPETEVTLRRTQSFQSDPKFYARYLQLRERIKASSYSRHAPLTSPALMRSPTSASLENLTNHVRIPMPCAANSTDNNCSPFSRIPAKDSPTETAEPEVPVANNIATTNSVSSQPTSVANSPTKPAVSPTKSVVSPAASPQPNNQVRSPQKPPVGAPNAAPSTPTTPGGTKLSPANIFKNFFKSFVPPVRDEESETQRKAHAKRVRETRRSTQGVTLDEIKSAEQLNKKKNQSPTLNNNNNEQLGANGDSAANGTSVTATITTAAPTVPVAATAPTTTTQQPLNRDTNCAADDQAVSHERRPSWRLKVDHCNKFKLEDATKTPEQPSSTVYVRRPSGGTSGGNSVQRPSSTPADSTPSAEATVTLSLRRTKTQEEKDQDKENDARNAQATLATQAAIQRRRRPKRRSTGVVHVDMDEIDPDRQDPGAGGDFEDPKVNHQESGSEKSNRSSRLGSASDLAALRGENGELDYKKMYESAVSENDRLRDKLRKSDEELRDTKQTLEKINTVTSKNSLSELEKRERRAMERKLSEMEEELKQLQKLKAENERLRAENRALTRVVSKLTNSSGKK